MFRSLYESLYLMINRRIVLTGSLLLLVILIIACDKNLEPKIKKASIPKIIRPSNNSMVKSKFEKMKEITISDVPKVFSELKENQKNASFAVFMFSGKNGVMNIQFSFENGAIGFDYVLLAPGNITDENKFLRFAKSKGFKMNKYEMNEVEYYRTEKGNLIELCSEIMTELYELSLDQKVEFLIQY